MSDWSEFTDEVSDWDDFAGEANQDLDEEETHKIGKTDNKE